MNRAIVPPVFVLVGLGVAAALAIGHSGQPNPVPEGEHAAGATASPSSTNVSEDAPLAVATEKVRLRVVSLTRRLSEPWALAFLPDGDILVTERKGRLRVIHDGQLKPDSISGIPAVDTRKQDGLMDLALHPNFAQNRTIYFTYSKSGDRGDTTVLARARFDGAALTDVRDLLVADAWDDYGGNSGSRIAFGRDGTLFMTVGERHLKEPAQDFGSHMGKVLRLNDDGTVPLDNPFVDRAGARPEIYAYGVRNPQGLFVDPATGRLWEHEHGPRGGDELNVIVRGHNYGWPLVTFGINYDGTIISKQTARAGMDAPVAHWVPSISPSGLTIYSGARFPAWKGNAFLGALSGEHLRRIELKDDRAGHEEQLQVTPLAQRIRDVREGPDGLLYVLTESGMLLRLEPE